MKESSFDKNVRLILEELRQIDERIDRRRKALAEFFTDEVPLDKFDCENYDNTVNIFLRYISDVYGVQCKFFASYYVYDCGLGKTSLTTAWNEKKYLLDGDDAFIKLLNIVSRDCEVISVKNI